MSGLCAWFDAARTGDRGEWTAAGIQGLRAPCGHDNPRRFACDDLIVEVLAGPVAASWHMTEAAAVCLYGRPLAPDGRRPWSAESAVADFVRHGVAALKAMDGSYLMLLYDRRSRTLHVQTDRIGSIQAYWRDDQGGWGVATEAKALFGCGSHPAIDDDALLASILFGRVKFSRQPFFTGIHSAQPGARLAFRAGNSPSTETHYRYTPPGNPASYTYEDAVADSVDTFRAAVNARIEAAEGPVALGLSGGLDSRLLAAAIAPENRHRVLAVSFGMAGNDESRIARSIATTLGLPYCDIELSPRHFVQCATSAIDASEGQDLYAQGYLFHVSQHLALRHGVTAFMDGMEVGASFGGDYLKDEFDALPPGELPAWVCRQFLFYPAPLEEFLVRVPGPLASLEVIHEAMRGFDHLPASFDRLDCFFLEYLIREVMRFRYRVMRRFLDPISIVSGRAYQELCARIPNRWRQGRRLQMDVIRALDPRLLDAPYHGHMVPLSAPRALRQRGAEQLRQQEQFSQDAWRDHRVLIPFDHYYTNFAQWYRSDPPTLRFVADLLDDGPCRIAGRWFRRDWMDRVLAEHRSGMHDHRTVISYLIGAELFLRRFEPIAP